jgi:hypothetical protein
LQKTLLKGAASYKHMPTSILKQKIKMPRPAPPIAAKLSSK